MTPPRSALPFTALVGQEAMKSALILNAINPAIGGVLIRGERGTAKSTAVRALARVLPEIDVVEGCRYRCDPSDPQRWCDDCRLRAAGGDDMSSSRVPLRVVELPINASEDRVVGTLDTEAAIKRGTRVFEAGVLADANRGILYIDEVNLLDDHLVDVLLDAAAMGRNTVEREGISFAHPAAFILAGTMNPDEGELRPQLLDRFGLCVDIAGLRSVQERVTIMERDAQSLDDHPGLRDDFSSTDEHLRSVVVKAQELLPQVEIPPQIRWFIALVCIDAGALGHRADIVVSNAARTLCAWREASRVVAAEEGGLDVDAARGLSVGTDDVTVAAELALAHRRRMRVESGSPAQPATAHQPSQERYEEMARQAETAVAQTVAQEEGDSSATDEQAGEQTDGDGHVRGDDRATDAVSRRAYQQLI